MVAYQWRKAFLRNMAENWSAILLKMSWIAVVFPMKVAASSVSGSFGATLHTEDLMLFGIQSTKYALFLF